MDSGSAIYWRLVFCIQLIPYLTYLVLALTKFSDFDSPSRIYSKGEHKKVDEILSSYIKPEHVTFMINSYKKIQDTEKGIQEENKKKRCSALVSIYNNYFYELMYALLFSLIHSLSS